jgi:phosphoribosyl 1,2-cyclic phosphodiesterase
MKLTFLGTRGGIIARSSLHFMHSVLLIQFRKTSLLIDWGADWLDKNPPSVDGLLLTHAHPDHSGGLAQGFPAPVYATQETFNLIKSYPLIQCNAIKHRISFMVGNIQVEPFDVYHSVRAPALGFRIQAGKISIFYVPDLVSIKDEKAALSNIDLYIGDGAIVTRRILVRTKNGIPVGHTPIFEQLFWCQKRQVPRAIITHCGSEITKADPIIIDQIVKELGLLRNVKTTIAYDGMTITL